MRLIAKGATSQTVYFSVNDSASTTGGKKTGIAFNAASLVASYTRNGAARTAITLATQTASGAWSSGGWVEVDATNEPGLYRFDVPDAAFASGVDSVVIQVRGASGMVDAVEEVQLTAVNLQDSVRAGLTALPNASAGANGGLPLGNASARVDVGNWLGTAVTAATAGVPDTNAARINNVVATSVTTINANVGTTQPTNFTGTGASALTKADMVDVAGAAVATGTAQIGTNVVTNGDKTGYALSAAAVQAIWDALTSVLTTVGSVGKLLVDNVNATISSRLATAGYTAPPSAASVSTQVWTEPIPGAFAAGSAGAKLNSASTAGDPWATAVPGAYGAGTAGNILGSRLDVAVSTRAASSVGGTVGSGSRLITINVQKPGSTGPLEGVACWISTDQAGTNVIAGTLDTDTSGNVQFMLDNGTYWLWRQLTPYTFTPNPQSFTVS